MKIAIYTRQLKESSYHVLNKIIEKLISNNVELLVNENLINLDAYKSNKNSISLYSDISKYELDFIICVGGDGTILDTVNKIYDKNIPIIGINLGRLGFLTNIPHSRIDECLNEILFLNNFSVDKRQLLKIDNVNVKDKYALNEITVQKSNTANLIVIHTYIDGKFLNSFWADGLIVSTPTGSTAYSLSVGGPIVAPNANNIIITPIAPHNLTVRPIVISDDCEIKLVVESRDEQFILSIDSEIIPINVEKNEIIINKSEYKIGMVQNKNHSFFDTIRNKLMWGIDKRNYDNSN